MTSTLSRQVAHTLGTRLATFACRAGLVVVLAKLFQPGEYGAYALIATLGTFGVVLAGLNLHAFVFRTNPGRPFAEQLSVFKTTFLFEMALSSGLVLACLGFGLLPLLLTLVKAEAYHFHFVVALFQLVLLVALAEVVQFLMSQSRIEEANWVDFLSQASWVPVLGLAWALGWRPGLLGLLVAQSAGCMIALAYGANRIGPSAFRLAPPQWNLLWGAIAFSLPMALPTLSLYSLKLADRFILSHLRSLEEVGIYSFAYMLVNTVYTFTAWIIFNTFGPRIIAAHNAHILEQRDILQTYMLKLAVVCFALAIVFLIAFAPSLVSLVARPEFLPAVQALPLVSLSYLFIILTFPAHYLLLLANKVKTIVAIDLTGVAISLWLDWTLIPNMSYIGAAVASAVGFGVVMVGKYVYSGVLGSLKPGILLSLSAEMQAVRRGLAYLRSRFA